MRLRWRDAFGFMFRSPTWRRATLVGGLLLLLLPPAGWLVALGYRKEVALRLVTGRAPPLPAWDWARVSGYLADGLRAAGVIVAYFAPFVLVFWSLSVGHPSNVVTHWREVAFFALAVLVLIPVALPLLPPLYWWLFPWIDLTGGEMAIVGVMFWLTTFVMPAAFMQVSLTGRFRDALRLPDVLRLIAACPAVYAEAWAISLTTTLAALASGPLAPWGIFWSYLVIVHAFNDALSWWDEPRVRQRFTRSVFASSR